MGTVPVVPVFLAGNLVTSGALNQLGAAITWYLTGRPQCNIQQAGGQSIPNATGTAVTWDTELEDRDNGHSTSVNPSRYTAQTPGIYLAAAALAYTGNSTGARYCMFRITTGSGNPAGSGVQTTFAPSALPAAGGNTTGAVAQSLTPLMYDGDYIEVLAYQNSGAALALQPSAGSQGPPYFSISLVSG